MAVVPVLPHLSPPLTVQPTRAALRPAHTGEGHPEVPLWGKQGARSATHDPFLSSIPCFSFSSVYNVVDALEYCW